LLHGQFTRGVFFDPRRTRQGMVSNKQSAEQEIPERQENQRSFSIFVHGLSIDPDDESSDQ
jgi:hypothetical protein